MDTEENLLDGDRGLPVLFLVQNRQANGSGRVDVRVKQGWYEFACECQLNSNALGNRSRTLRWLCWILYYMGQSSGL